MLTNFLAVPGVKGPRPSGALYYLRYITLVMAGGIAYIQCSHYVNTEHRMCQYLLKPRRLCLDEMTTIDRRWRIEPRKYSCSTRKFVCFCEHNAQVH